MVDPIDRAREMVSALERADAEAALRLWFQSEIDWSFADWIRDGWAARLDLMAGVPRRVVDAWRVHDEMVRFRLAGDRGEAYVTVLINQDGRVFGLAVDAEVRQGDFGICIGCGPGGDETLRGFYDELVAGQFSFGDGGDEPPRWPDPDFPAQVHLDVLVPDLDLAGAKVLALGATQLRDSGHFRVFEDPAGHPFCLYVAGEDVVPDGAHVGVLGRVVIDCADVAQLAAFWSQMLPFPRYIEVQPDRIVIAREDGSLPRLGFQRVEDYHAPTWPAAEYPEQIHFDIGYDDRPAMERKALEIGATKLAPQGGSCPVYADPAGHPFCLCMTGE